MNGDRKGNWHILGAGSQGLLWAAALTEAGLPVTLLRHRRLPADAYDADGRLRLHDEAADGQQNLRRVRCLTLDVDTLADEPVRQLLVTTKATDLAAALTGLTQALGPAAMPARVILLQNGIGAEGIARQQLPAGTALWLGSSSHGSFRRAGNHLVRAGKGAVWLGLASPGDARPDDAETLAALQRTTLAVQWAEAIQLRLWHKLLLNACINPLTALLDCRNGELLTLPLAQDWLPALAAEAAAVARAEGYAIEANGLLADIRAVAQATASNFNSMQQDFQAGRATEIEFITGALVAAAARHGLAVPHHDMLLAQVRNRQPFAPAGQS